MEGKHKVSLGADGSKKRKFKQKGKGGKGKGARGKGGKDDLEFLYKEDDGGHFGLLKHTIPSDLTKRNWVSVDLGDVIPEGFDVSQFGDIVGIQQLDPDDYPEVPAHKRKAAHEESASEKKPKKKKQKKQKEHKEQKDNNEQAHNGHQESNGQQEQKNTKKQKNQKGATKHTQKGNNGTANNTEAETGSVNVAGNTSKGDGRKKVNTHSGQKSQNAEKKDNSQPDYRGEGVADDLQSIGAVDVSAWEEYKLHFKLVDGIRQLRFSTPTEIQKRAIPVAIACKDIVAAAETGSGKTLAFGLPILHNILLEKERNPTEKVTREGPLALIISPTRELASQIVDHLKAVAKFTTIHEISVVPIIGGMSVPKQVRLLSYKPDIVVATPGRLWDLYESGNEYLNHLDSVKWVVLDEADRLIQGNHFKEMDMVFEKLQMKKTDDHVKRTKRQIFLFSATLIDQNIHIHKSNSSLNNSKGATSSIAKLFSMIKFQNPVETIDITKSQLTATNLREAKILCEDKDKDYQIYYLLQRYKGKSIVFVNSIHGVKRLTSLLRVLGVSAFPLYSDMEQRMRLKNLDRFKVAERAVLVATDVAARGLDIPNIDHVFHFQIPLNAETYVHRSGRTARANKDGIAVMLVSPEDQKNFIKIFGVLKKDVASVVDFPVDNYFMPAIKKRVDLAHQIEVSGHRTKKAATEKQWIMKNVETAGGNVKDYYPSSDDEDDKTITAKKIKKRHEANVHQMQQELTTLLSKPLLPIGINRSYITSTHFSTALLVDPASFHTSGAIQDLDGSVSSVDKNKRKSK